ncbi:MAG: transporter substrate-binding domain-containing protein, partial [Victivallaceae bacterium]
KWCGGDDAKKVLANWTHKKDFTGQNGTLRFGSDPTQEPMCYTDAANNPIGLDVEIMNRIAYELDMNFEFVPMNFGSLIEALISEKITAAGASMSITEERKKRVDFAESYYEGGLSILARRYPQESIEKIVDLNGKRIGILSGTTMDRAVNENFPEATPVYHNSFTDLPLALESGKLDAFLLEEPQFRVMSKTRPNLVVLPKKLSSDDYAFVFAQKNSELCDAFSAQIRAMKEDGTLKRLDDKWFSGIESQYTLPAPLADPPNGELRFGTVPQLMPFSFMKGDIVVGYDIEVAQLAAAKLGYVLKPVVMEWNSLIEAVAVGKVDLG